MRRRFPALDLVLLESGGDNLAATFSPELADLTIYVIDVAGGEKIPRKGAPASPLRPPRHQQDRPRAPRRRRSRVMEEDTKRMRGARPYVFASLRHGDGVEAVARFVVEAGGL